jgi:hypothetical protein
VDPDELEHVGLGIALREDGHLLREEADVDDAHQPPRRIDDGNREETVAEEGLGRDLNGVGRRHRHQCGDHEVRDRRLGGPGQQTPRGHDSHEAPSWIGHVEVDDLLGQARSRPQILDRRRDGLLRAERDPIEMGVERHRLAEVVRRERTRAHADASTRGRIARQVATARRAAETGNTRMIIARPYRSRAG